MPDEGICCFGVESDGVDAKSASRETAIHRNSIIRNVCAYRTALHLLNRFEVAPKVEMFEKQEDN